MIDPRPNRRTSDRAKLEKLLTVAEVEERDRIAPKNEYAGYRGRGAGKPLTVVNFADVSDLLDFSTSRYDSSWSRGEFSSMSELLAAEREGRIGPQLKALYNEVREVIEPAAEKATQRTETTKRRRRVRDAGDEVLVDRWLSGDIECWETRERGKKRKRVRIGVQFGYLGSASTRDFAVTGAIATAASDILQRLGYAVEIVGIWTTTCSSGDQLAVVAPVKRVDAPLDTDAALIVGMPSLQRIHAFELRHVLFGSSGSATFTPTRSILDACDIDVLVANEPTGKLAEPDSDLGEFFAEAYALADAWRHGQTSDALDAMRSRVRARRRRR